MTTKIRIEGFKRGAIGYSSEDPKFETDSDKFIHIPQLGQTLEIEGVFYIEVTKVEYYFNPKDATESCIYIRGVLL